MIVRRVKMFFRLTKLKRFFAYAVIVKFFLTLYLIHSYIDFNSFSFSSPTVRTEPFPNDALTTPRKYHSSVLHEYVPAVHVPNAPDLPGELGRPVELNSKEEEEGKRRFKEHEFNVVVSEMISVNRSLPDVRVPECLTITYQSRLPTTSIVIIFHNEAWCTLTRSMWSIINRSPRKLLKEIILVDDKSTLEHLGDQLDEYAKTLPVPVKVVRMEERFGIVRARLRGAKVATGEVITFFDSHIECGDGWLEPLLSRITENRRIVAIPVIDIISDKTFAYKEANIKVYGGTDWKLYYQWVDIPKREKDRIGNSSVAPLYSPTMAGGLFSIDREFFYDIGSYDDGMIIWGSENIEMSFRVWMCGGVLEQVPCSRVGHVYRKLSPYPYPEGQKGFVQAYNKNRLATVWLDDWIEFFDILNPGRIETQSEIDVSSRIDFRKKLNCKSFQWYVDNIYPEFDTKKDITFMGQIQNVATNTCLVANGDKTDMVLYTCAVSAANQIFLVTKRKEIRNFDQCIDAASANATVQTWQCHNLGGNQQWEYNDQDMTLRHITGNCLQRDGSKSKLGPCDGSDQQKWTLISRQS
ncbi:polypeptide N-acetylgalactosaminyltransferase 5-like [Bradysia coprophila]|uniref:polypeptide N-acetylgalactosaminyltransferase 5-like n=1 Tax=Bradysia coprophila TaxID=38358 RepID=UPI00187DD278|nr:polypeptide N-acetylgalactosaminyltransferase 5-like [Bradysia coprophila]